MQYKEFKPVIIATIVMIAMIGALCIATPAMAESGCDGLDQTVLIRYDHNKNGLIDSNEMEAAKIGYESNYETQSDYDQILYAYEHNCPVESIASPTPCEGRAKLWVARGYPGVITVGDTYHVSIRIINKGTRAATDIVIDEPFLPGTYKEGFPSVLDDIAPGAELLVYYDLRVVDAKVGVFSLPPTVLNYKCGCDESCSSMSYGNGGEVLPDPTEAPTGRIYVSSTPSGAYIYLDGRYEGTTSKTLTDVPVGSHTIRLAKSGYEDYTRTVYVSAGDTASVSASLSVIPTPTPEETPTEVASTGRISVSSSPSGADIYLDGAYKGTTPTTISDASPGAHALKLEKYGYEEWLTSVHVASGVTESITAHLTAADVSPPAIRIDKPAIIDQNNNELLEEGEKVTITYGANDPSGVASIKILLDGAMLESQNQVGTYTVTTNSLTMGEHTIRVEATDSKSNRGFEELLLTVERTGPSVYFGTTRNTIEKGEDAIFTLSAVNPIGNPPMTVQLILKPPNGVSVTSSSFAKAGSGIHTCTQTIESGDNLRSIEVHLTGNEVGAHEIESEVYYQFRGSPKSPTRYDTLTLVVDEHDPLPPEPTPKPLPGFTTVVAIIGILLAHDRIRI